MKKANVLILFIFILFFTQCNKKIEYKTKTVTDSNGYTYEYVTNDPLAARIYTLNNGLKVYLTINKDAPRVQTCIAVKTGSSYDPKETTGLAHYLEHMMFKGTDEIATQDWENEEKALKQISELYELHKNTNSPDEKKAIYKKIDSISQIAATYALPNEYDKIITSIGGTGTNAYTSNEQTVYINDIPANQIENWLRIEKERFSKLVLRLFHTELETVYEEFNMSQDDDYSKSNDVLMKTIFPQHPYGTQTTIGEGEHLKNPSMVNIHKFWETYYVPNNMAVCISGDLDFDSTIKLVDQYFGDFVKKDVPEIVFPESPKLTKNEIKEVVGPDKDFLEMAFRFDGVKSEDYYYVSLINAMMQNYTAGLINIDLIQTQKVLDAYAYCWFLKQYGIHEFYVDLREGQTFEEAQNLILQEIDKIKKGEFEEWMISAAAKDLKIKNIRTRETNNKVYEFVSAFIDSRTWEEYVSEEQKLANIKKEDLVKFANEKYNYFVAVYKKNGTDTVSIKIEKPEITNIELNRTNKSKFFEAIESNKTTPSQPVWIDFKKDIKEEVIKDGLTINYIQNTDNEIFKVYYVFDIGNLHSKELSMALNYLNYIGTDKYSASDIKKEFYKLGVEMFINTDENNSYVYLMGLEEALEDGVKLLEHLIDNAKADTASYNKYVEGILKLREDNKLNKYAIIFDGFYNFAQYGKFSPLTNVISEEDLRKLNPDTLTSIIKSLKDYKHRIFYYGQKDFETAKKIITQYHIIPDKLKEIPQEIEYSYADFNENKVYILDYDMVQTWLFMVTKDEIYNSNNSPFSQIFNEYFGSGLSSIVFQEIREARGLAYMAYSYFSMPSRTDEFHYNYSTLSTQPDKLTEAITAMLQLLNEMPQAEIQFNASKDAVIQSYQTKRIVRSNIFWTYLKNKNLNIDHDIRKDDYEVIKNMNISQLNEFFEKHITNKKYGFFIIGEKDKIDIKQLEKFGKVEILTLKDIFNY